MDFILAIDQGTTSSRSLIFDTKGQVKGVSQKEFTQYFPQPGWVEHDAEEIWETQLLTIKESIKNAGISVSQLKAIGITNQRETTVIWNKNTGKPISKAIVWQDKRTANVCEELIARNLKNYVIEQTGLVIDAYFSATKIKWLLDNVANARNQALKGELLFGTIDTWLLWKLTNGKSHFTDYTNASRTMLYNIKSLHWDKKMLDELDIPESILPNVKPSISNFGNAELEGIQIPILGIAGDQQSALFGQKCFESGMAKNTYGTGCFMLMNTGKKKYVSECGLLTTLACSLNDSRPDYALEGSVFIAGAAINWLRDGLGIINHAKETEAMAVSVPDSNGVYMIPAFSGLGTPYWDMYAKGAILGLTRDSNKNHIVRATLESLAYQTKDVLSVMQQESGIFLKKLKVDGGVCANNFLMQFQADVLDVPVERSTISEVTAFGVFLLAALGANVIQKENIDQLNPPERVFESVMNEKQRELLYKGWQQAIGKVMHQNK
jgi:glycerol kinase